MAQQLLTFTAFCQDLDGTGTIWISTIESPDLESAVGIAQTACAADWGYEPDEVHVLGLAAGKVEIVYWEDIDG